MYACVNVLATGNAFESLFLLAFLTPVSIFRNMFRMNLVTYVQPEQIG